MANKFYPKGAEKVLNAAVNFSTANISVALVANAYTYSDAHEYLSDLGATVGTAQPLASKSTAGGVFDADDVDLGSPAIGSVLGSLLIYKDTGNAATSPVLLNLTDVVGFPMNTNGSGVQLRWSDGSAKLFSLIPA